MSVFPTFDLRVITYDFLTKTWLVSRETNQTFQLLTSFLFTSMYIFKFITIGNSVKANGDWDRGSAFAFWAGTGISGIGTVMGGQAIIQMPGLSIKAWHVNKGNGMRHQNYQKRIKKPKTI